MTATAATNPGECQIVTVERRLTAVVRAQVRFADIPPTQRALRPKIQSVVRSLDVGPLGHAFTLWRPMGDGRLDMEIGVLVARTFAQVDDVVPSALPAGRAVQFLLMGSYAGLPGAYRSLFAWCAERALPVADINWEIYGDWNDDPAKLETTVYALLG